MFWPNRWSQQPWIRSPVAAAGFQQVSRLRLVTHRHRSVRPTASNRAAGGSHESQRRQRRTVRHSHYAAFGLRPLLATVRPGIFPAHPSRDQPALTRRVRKLGRIRFPGKS
jgi:hypothetical protein